MSDTWLRLATTRPVVRRAMLYAVTVGPVLIAINHADALYHGDINTTRLLKMAMTILVPYCVSTMSSVGATRAATKCRMDAHESP